MKGIKNFRLPDRNAAKINEMLVSHLSKNDGGSKISLSNVAKMLGDRRETALKEAENE